MVNNEKSYLSAFTIMEITISLVVTSIVITLVYSAISFLNSQLKKDVEIRNQLNTWSVERFHLIHDFFMANEVVVLETSEVHLKSDGAHVIKYKKEEDILFRVNKENTLAFQTKIKSIQLPDKENVHSERIIFIFEIMGEMFPLQFPINQSSAEKMNDWFTQKMNDGSN
jgi:hypothetical protein